MEKKYFKRKAPPECSWGFQIIEISGPRVGRVITYRNPTLTRGTTTTHPSAYIIEDQTTPLLEMNETKFEMLWNLAEISLHA